MSDKDYPQRWGGWSVERELPEIKGRTLVYGRSVAGGPAYVLEFDSEPTPVYCVPPELHRLMAEEAKLLPAYRRDQLMAEIAVEVLEAEEQARRQGVEHGKRLQRQALHEALGIKAIVDPLETIATALQERGA